MDSQFLMVPELVRFINGIVSGRLLHLVMEQATVISNVHIIVTRHLTSLSVDTGNTSRAPSGFDRRWRATSTNISRL